MAQGTEPSPGAVVPDLAAELPRLGTGQPKPAGLSTDPRTDPAALHGLEPAEPPSPPSSSGLPATYEEFRRQTTTGWGAFWDRVLWPLKLPVRLIKFIHAEIIARSDGTLEEYSQRLEKDLAGILGASEGLSFNDPSFVASFEEKLGVRFLPGNRVAPLTDGPASFAKRFELIEGAKRTIHLMTWAIYDDETGFDFVQKLIGKTREGVQVRVLVDGQVAADQKAKHKLLELLETAGIPVVRWHNPDPSHPYDGQHRKVMIVDSEAAVAGGMNVGDHYSHMGKSKKWRDQDILVEGPAALESERLFVREWNAQIERMEASSSETETQEMRRKGCVRLPEPDPAPSAEGGSRVALIDHVPRENDNGLKSVLLSVEAAQRSIDIENGYFILTPALFRALERAQARGVRVRIFMNSPESLDVPALLYPMLLSAEEVRQKGVEMYLKKGPTLHGKFMIVDDNYTWAGSYNFQPRSDRMERELLYGVLDPAFADEMRRIFEEDIAQADRLLGPPEIPWSVLNRLIYHFFYYQL